jgi:2-phosphoglycerate kinase
MAKIMVIKEPGEDGVPFLRGILVQSLLSAGLSFQNAYATAQAVRDRLENNDIVTTPELKAIVAAQLGKEFGPQIRANYETGAEHRPTITVNSDRGERRFSVGMLTRSLEACAIDTESASDVAQRVHETIKKSGQSEIDSAALRRIIYRSLREHCSARTANYYLSRRRFGISGEPLIILVGGASGTGKSAVSTELAYRLGVVRTQSTDMMREIIRCYLSPHLVPTLGYSSFDAWRGLPPLEKPNGQRTGDNQVIAGFLAQCANVESALNATIARAVKEHHDIIIDGVHIVPTDMNLANSGKKAIIVPVMLAVTNKQRLVDQLSWRSSKQPDRRSSRYQEQIDAIWELQSFLLKRAEEANIPIVANWDIEDTIRDILDKVNRKISERYPPDPAILE